MTSDAFHRDPLTWAVLLAQWTEFAKSAVALPQDGDAGRHRRSVVPLISLAAIAHALGELARLDETERAVALDKAEIQIRQDVVALDQIWDGTQPPDEVWSFVERAALALGEAQGVDPDTEDAGIDRVAWFAAGDGLSWDHPGGLLTALSGCSPTLEVWVPSPGVPFFEGAVVCHAQDVAGLSDEVLGRIDAFLGGDAEGPVEVVERYQVFRQFDFLKGGAERDVLAPEALHDAVPGQPLLVLGLRPDSKSGESVIEPVPMPPRKSPPVGPLRVYEAVPEDEEDED